MDDVNPVPLQPPVEDVKPSLSSDNVKVERPRSPEANCAICLEEVRNRCFTDTCQHQFCFSCLFEWSKVKPECPLCKQIFSKIIPESDGVNVGLGEPLQIRPPSPQIREGFPGGRPVFFNLAIDHANNHIRRPGTMMLFGENGHQWTTPNYHHTSGRFVEDWRRRRQQAANDFRRNVYRQGLWVRPGTEQRVRDCSPEFYRLNPAQTHRLVPWLQREFNVLLDVSIDSASVVEEVLSLILVYPINSLYFNRAMSRYLGPRTEHFQHEFYHFARSPYDLFAYDLRAEYAPNSPAVVSNQRAGSPGGNGSVISSSSSDSDVEVTTDLSNRWGIPVLRMDFAMDILSAIGSGNTRPSRETVIELSDDDDVVVETNNNVQREEVLSDSDSVEIIGVVPPRHLRTPEIIDIASSSGEEENKADVKTQPSDTNRLEAPGTSRMTVDEAYERSRRSHYSSSSSDESSKQARSRRHKVGKSSRRRRSFRNSESPSSTVPKKRYKKNSSKTSKTSTNPRPEGYNTRQSARMSPKSRGDDQIDRSDSRPPKIRSVVRLVRQRDHTQGSPIQLRWSVARSSNEGSDSERCQSRSTKSAPRTSGDETDSEPTQTRPISLRHHRTRYYYFDSDTDLDC